jgi:hypothetical protein
MLYNSLKSKKYVFLRVCVNEYISLGDTINGKNKTENQKMSGIIYSPCVENYSHICIQIQIKQQ